MLKKVGLVAMVGVVVLAGSALGAQVSSLSYSLSGPNLSRCEMQFLTSINNDTSSTLNFKMSALNQDSKFNCNVNVKPHSSNSLWLGWDTQSKNLHNKNIGTLLINGSPSQNKTNNFTFVQNGSYNDAHIHFNNGEVLNYSNYKATITDTYGNFTITVTPLTK